MVWDPDSADVMFGTWAFIATAFGGWATWKRGREANELQRHNNQLEQRNGDLQQQIVRLEEARDARAGPLRRAAVASMMLVDLSRAEAAMMDQYYFPDDDLLTHLPDFAVLDRAAEFVDLLPTETLRFVTSVHTAILPSLTYISESGSARSSIHFRQRFSTTNAPAFEPGLRCSQSLPRGVRHATAE
jgi:hypothetical protein